MRFVTTFFLAFILSGCGILQSARTSDYTKRQRLLNLDPYHVQSCGPEAVQKALLQFGIQSDLENLSHAMQSSPSCANLMRDIVSIFDINGRRITFPSELKTILREHGLKVTSVKKLENLDQNKDTAVVLVKRNGSLEYHWMCFPIDKNIKNFFGKETLIKEIYLITK